MPVDVTHRSFYGRGGPAFLTQRYSPLPPLHEVPVKRPSVPTEVRLNDRGKAQVQPTSLSFAPGRGLIRNRSPISRPCMRFKSTASPPSPRRYRKLSNTEGGDDINKKGIAGGGLLRAVANRGRGYEDLRCRGAGGNVPDSGENSPAESPRISPNVSPRGRHSGILITSSAIAKSGIKRLSRVSFGSSKGSMVETLIYESPVAEEERIPEEDTLITDPVAQKLGSETGEPHKPASRVRVTFFESEKPLAVTSPEPPDLNSFGAYYDLAMTSPAPDAVPAFDRQLSNESGRDNPFRPDGDISKEADEIVQMIKSGRPLDANSQKHASGDDLADGPYSPSSPVRGESNEPLIEPPATKDNSLANKQQQQQQNSPPTSLQKSGANGSASTAEPSPPGPVEIKHGTVTPSEPAQVEHITLKKKNKCSCCVIQ